MYIVGRVIVDLVGATFSQLMVNQVWSEFRLFCSCFVVVMMSLCVDVIVKSSAYEIMLMLLGEGGVSCM